MFNHVSKRVESRGMLVNDTKTGLLCVSATRSFESKAVIKRMNEWAQRRINLEIPVLVRSPKTSNIKLGYCLDGRLFNCYLSVAANP